MMNSLQVHTASISQMMEEKFGRLDRILGQIIADINKVRQTVSKNAEDIVTLKENDNNVSNRLDQLEKDMNTLDSDSRQNKLTFFGLPEMERENSNSIVDQIVELLNESSMRRTWHEHDFETAHRIGSSRHQRQQPRPVVVRFYRRRDKVEVLSNKELRDGLRREGVRVSAELTVHQREQVQHYREPGIQAFFRNGKLQINDTRPLPPRSFDRSHRRSNRHEQHEDEPQRGKERLSKQPASTVATDQYEGTQRERRDRVSSSRRNRMDDEDRGNGHWRSQHDYHVSYEPSYENHRVFQRHRQHSAHSASGYWTAPDHPKQVQTTSDDTRDEDQEKEATEQTDGTTSHSGNDTTHGTRQPPAEVGIRAPTPASPCQARLQPSRQDAARYRVRQLW